MVRLMKSMPGTIRKVIWIFPLILAWMPLASAQSVVGHWQSVNEETGKVESVVEIWTEAGELQGKIVELIEPVEPNPLCLECEGELKDQAIIGMQIIWGLSDNDGDWEGGYILDPNNGKTYNSIIKLNDEGQLEVRGFIGFAALGRTQIWYRAEQ